MSVALRLTCECTNRTYASRASLKTHQKSKIHLAWARNEEIKHLRVRLGKMEKDLAVLENDRKWLQTKVLKLMKHNEEQSTTVEQLRHLNQKLTQQIYALRKTKKVSQS
jgi:predicted nuclease with TOPRIM domain